MLLLVSTPLQILSVDTLSGQVSVIRTGDGYYYGISHKNGTIVLSSTAGLLQYFNLDARPIFTERCLIHPHQIEWVDDKVLVTNTGRNFISVFDGKGNLCREAYLNEIRFDDKDKDRTGNHFNSIHRAGDRVYVVAHNYERPSEVWELTWPELEVISVKVTRASWAHNIWPGEWGLVICDTRHSSLYDVFSGETIWKSNEEAVMTRGLAVSEDYIFIGCSTYAKRNDRFWKTGGIWIVDRKTLKTLDKIVLPGSGDVHEIRLIDVPDDCHNGQVICNANLEIIRKESSFISIAYELRKLSPKFRRDLLPISVFIRAIQLSNRWKMAAQRRYHNIQSTD